MKQELMGVARKSAATRTASSHDYQEQSMHSRGVGRQLGGLLSDATGRRTVPAWFLARFEPLKTF
jgi:hypothetical protein